MLFHRVILPSRVVGHLAEKTSIGKLGLDAAWMQMVNKYNYEKTNYEAASTNSNVFNIGDVIVELNFFDLNPSCKYIKQKTCNCHGL